MPRAEGRFKVTHWDEKTYEELGGKAKLTRARITQDFEGDIAGKGTWDLHMCYREDGTAVFAGLGRIDGTVAGRAGSVVFETVGTFDGKEAKSTWTVIVGSGTDALRGLRGKGRSVAPLGPDGTLSLDYEVG